MSDSKYYVKVLNSDPDTGRRRRDRLYIDMNKGLGNWLRYNNILERRVQVNDPADFQAMLDEGRKFILYRFFQPRWRWRALLNMDASNTYIDGDDLVYHKGEEFRNAKPFLYSGGLLGKEDDCIDSMIVEVFQDLEDRKAAKRANEAVEEGRDLPGINPFLKRAYR